MAEPLTPLQSEGLRHLMTMDSSSRGRALWMDPGLGKTRVVLEWIRATKPTGRTVVVAPVNVLRNTWPREIAKWTPDLSFATLDGSPAKREKKWQSSSDIYLISCDNVKWLLPRVEDWSGGVNLILDESTRFKSWMSLRTRALREYLGRFSRVIQLTGTPTPKDYIDLFAQVYLLDGGASLGFTVGSFRTRFCIGRRVGPTAMSWSFDVRRKLDLERRITHLVYRADRSELAESLPKLTTNVIWVDLPPKARKAYDQLEREYFLGEPYDLDVETAMCRFLRLRSIAQGAYYDPANGSAVLVHRAKLDAIESLREELQSKGLAIAYDYRFCASMLRELFGDRVHFIGSDVSAKDTSTIIDSWNRHDIDTIAGNPASVSEGLNLQAGGSDLVFWGVPLRWDHYEQMVCRLYRQGQRHPTRVHVVLVRGTVDEVIWGRIKNRETSQNALLNRMSDHGRTRSVGGAMSR